MNDLKIIKLKSFKKIIYSYSENNNNLNETRKTITNMNNLNLTLHSKLIFCF